MATVIHVRSFLTMERLEAHVEMLKKEHKTDNIEYKFINSINFKARFFNKDIKNKPNCVPRKNKEVNTDHLDPFDRRLLAILTSYRIENVITQKKMSKLLGCSIASYLRFESGYMTDFMRRKVETHFPYCLKDEVPLKVDNSFLPTGIKLYF